MATASDLALANRLAEAAGEAIRPLFRGEWSQEQKADRSFVTEADQAAEAAMRAILESERSDDGIIGEEYGTRNEGAGRQWVLDPIDGTTSFIAGRPIFGTLIALMQEGWPVLGTTTPHQFAGDDVDAFMGVVKSVAERKIIYGGDCYNYGLVASGHVDVVVEAGLKLHDFAALVPVVEGAGGVMSDWQGNPLDAESDGRVIALGDAARLEDVLEAMGGGSLHDHGH
ncbi:MAG: inositol monophosphatase family protein [Pseudomonadota bacterium]|nr:inositol monophosphatase family protein [Pseudomonadota bacterium]